MVIHGADIKAKTIKNTTLGLIAAKAGYKNIEDELKQYIKKAKQKAKQKAKLKKQLELRKKYE